jgi:hypothetical protein
LSRELISVVGASDASRDLTAFLDTRSAVGAHFWN